MNQEEILLKQFNEEFGSQIKLNYKKTPLLLNMFNDYIEQTFKACKYYNKLIDKIETLETELLKTLNEKQHTIIKELEFYIDKVNSYENEQSFIYGYCLDKELIIEKERK